MTKEKAKAILEAVKNHDSYEIWELCENDKEAVRFIIRQLLDTEHRIKQAIKHLTE